MTGEQRKRLLDYKARQAAGEKLPCPRCGEDTMRPVLHSNALSRHADIMICPDCGQTEALDDLFGVLTSISEWAFMREVPSETYVLRFMALDSQAPCDQREFGSEGRAWEAFRYFAEKRSMDKYSGIKLIRRDWEAIKEMTIAELNFPRQ